MDAAATTPDYKIRHLYKSYLSCADYLDSSLLDAIHISTPVEHKTILATKERKIVFATGNPGDGKTLLIRKIQGEFPKGVEVILDANEREDDELIAAIEKAYEDNSGLVVAINEGILLDLCEKARKKCLWADSVINAVLKPYVYGSEVQKLDAKILVLDLSLRNNLSQPIVEQAIDKIVALTPKDSPMWDSYNLKCLQHPVVKTRIAKLLDAVGRTGFHSTMRDLFGFLSFLICGGEDGNDGGQPTPYYINAFVGGTGALFDHVREFDPIFMPYPFLDESLFMADDDPDDWHNNDPNEYLTPGDLDVYKNRKRRALFEHKNGEKILKAERTDIDRVFKKLRSTEQSPEYVAIDLLNKFFESTRGSDNLVLWFGHQFSAQALKYVASRQEINAAEFEVLVPELPVQVKDAFIDHYPDHVVFKSKNMPAPSGLVMDRRFIRMLMAGDRLSGFGVRSMEVQTKVAAFYDRLAKVHTQKKSVVQILKLENQKIERIGIDERERAYFIPGAA